MKKLIKLIILVIIFQSCTTNKSLIYSIPIEIQMNHSTWQNITPLYKVHLLNNYKEYKNVKN